MGSRIVFVIGLSFLWPCLRNTFFKSFAVSDGFSEPSLFLFASILVCAAVFGSLRSSGRAVTLLFCRPVIFGSALVASVLLFSSNWFDIVPLEVIAAVFSGCSFSFLAIGWADVGYCLKRKSVSSWIVFDVILSLLVSYIATAFVIPFPDAAQVVYPWFIVLSSLAYCVILEGFRGEKENRGTCSLAHPNGKRTESFLPPIAFFIIIVSVVAGVYSSGVSTLFDGREPEKYFVSVAVTALLSLICAWLSKRPNRMKFIWGFALLLEFAGSLASLAFDSNVGSDVVVIGRIVILVLFWSMLIERSESHRMLLRNVAVFFLGSKGVSLALTDAMALANRADIIPDFAIQVVLLLSILALIACAFIFVDAWDLGFSGDANERNKAEGPFECDAGRLEICKRMGIEYGLTERELSVMALLSRGYTAKKVGESLYLSENTVRSHTKSLYRKLGCHSKQELIDFVSRELK